MTGGRVESGNGEKKEREGKRVALHARRIGRGAEGSRREGEGGEILIIGFGLALGMAWKLYEVPSVSNKGRRRRGKMRRQGGECAMERGKKEITNFAFDACVLYKIMQYAHINHSILILMLVSFVIILKIEYIIRLFRYNMEDSNEPALIYYF
jgi:hypothetical protein